MADHDLLQKQGIKHANETHSSLDRAFDKLDYEYNTLMSSMHVSVSKHLLDEHFSCVWANNYYDIIGYSKEEYEALYQNHASLFFRELPEEYEKIKAVVAKALKEKQPGYECVCQMPQKGGKKIWVRLVGTFTDEVRNGYPVVYTIFTDITDIVEQKELQKRLEERSEMLRNALEMAQRANHAKSDFFPGCPMISVRR